MLWQSYENVVCMAQAMQEALRELDDEQFLLFVTGLFASSTVVIAQLVAAVS
jgi:hypothetical protein